MKGWPKVVLVLALVALGGCTLVGCGGGSGPEATVRGAFKAMEAKDAEKLATYFTEDVNDEMVAEAQQYFDIFDSIKIANLKLTVVSQTEDAATIEAEYDFELKAFGQTSQEHQSDTMDLVKVNGKWLITEPIG